MKSAEKLSAGMNLINDALRELAAAGYEPRPLSQVALLAYELTGALAELPEAICDGHTPHCARCEYASTSVELLPYGDRSVRREQHECLAPSALKCPAVNAAGWGDPDRPETMIPAWLTRQAS
jgi:hypothetical protein